MGGGAAAPVEGTAPAGHTPGWVRALGGWAKLGSGAAGRGSGSALRSLALGGEPRLADRELRVLVQRPAGPPQCPAPALRFLRAARPRSVLRPAEPSLSRPVSAHIAALREPALPGFRLAHPLIPIVVGIRVPTGNVAMPLCPMQVGKGIRWLGGLKGWTEEGCKGRGACWMLASWEEGWCGLDVQPTRITLAAILGG